VRTTRKSWFLVVLALALTLAACSGAQQEETAIQAAGAQTAADPYAAQQAGDTAVAQAPEAAAGAQLVLGECGPLGQCITNPEGKVLYGFTDDTQNSGTSACAADCLANWPAWGTEGAPQAGEGVDPAKVSTITGTDGAAQVAYNGWPLYFYAGDPGAGTWNGQGVGGKWYVVNAAGQLVKEAPADAAAAETEAPVLTPEQAQDAYSGTEAYEAAPAAPAAPAPAAPAPAPAPAAGSADRGEAASGARGDGSCPEAENVTLEVADSAYGRYVRTADGNCTVYFKDLEPRDQMTCTGACADRYKPIRGQATAEAGSGLSDSLIGVSPDGYLTINGWVAYWKVSESEWGGEITGSPNWTLVAPDGSRLVGGDMGSGEAEPGAAYSTAADSGSGY